MGHGQAQQSNPVSLQEGGDTARGEGSEQLLEDSLDPVATPLGFEIIAVEIIGRGRGRIFRIYLDRRGDDAGVTLDDCTRMGRVISAALDAAELATGGSGALRGLLADPYTLEVSSPGIERLLTKRHHYERFAGSRVVIRTRRALPGATGEQARQRVFHGTINGAVADSAAPEDPRRGMVSIRGLDGGGQVYEIPLTAIKRANLVYEG